MGKSSGVSFTWGRSAREELFPGPSRVLVKGGFLLWWKGVNWSTQGIASRIKWVEPLLCYETDNAVSGDSVSGGNIGLVTE